MKTKLMPPPYLFGLKDRINLYLHDTLYMILLALTAVGSYGFLISHYSVSTDDLLYRYYYYGGLFSQGRFTGSLVERLFHMTDNFFWIQDFLGIVFLCFAAILLCAFLDSFYQTQNHIPQLLFSCLLVSYPLHATLFIYGGCSLAFGAGLTMVAGSLFLVREFVASRRIKYLIMALIPLVFAVSWYESTLILYVQAVLAALMLYQIGTARMKPAELFANGFVYALPLIVSVVLEFLLSKALIAALRIAASDYTANKAFALDFSDKTTLLDQLNYIVMGNYFRSAVQALFSAPMLVFGAAFFILFLIGLVCGVRQKSAVLFWTCFGLLAVNFALPLAMGKAAPRTCQSFAFTVAFVAFLVYDFCSVRTEKRPKTVARLVLISLSCLIFGQIIQINGLFTVDNMRYQQEKAIVDGVGDYLLANDLDHKPVAFAGRVDFNDSIKSRIFVRKDNKLLQVLLKVPHLGEYCKGLYEGRSDAYAFPRLEGFCISYLNHAMSCKDAYSEITLFFRYCGFDTVRYASEAQQDAAQQYAAELPAWPRPDAVKDMGDYVIVNLGGTTMESSADAP